MKSWHNNGTVGTRGSKIGGWGLRRKARLHGESVGGRSKKNGFAKWVGVEGWGLGVENRFLVGLMIFYLLMYYFESLD